MTRVLKQVYDLDSITVLMITLKKSKTVLYLRFNGGLFFSLFVFNKIKRKIPEQYSKYKKLLSGWNTTSIIRYFLETNDSYDIPLSIQYKVNKKNNSSYIFNEFNKKDFIQTNLQQLKEQINGTLKK